jgi:hypothetical protein
VADAPVFFVSYARQDARYPEDREILLGFVKKLEARVAAAMGLPPEGVSEMDEHIQAGEIWSEALRDSLMRCRIGVALYSPSYFNRRWCGQEFQVFLNRSRPAPGGTGIVPIRWEQKFEPPDCAARIQYDDGTLPREYISMGMRQLAALKDAFLPQYTIAVQALANRIVEEAKANRLAPLADLDFDKTRSAWEAEVINDPQSHTQGNISKTCFVFIAGKGWDWVPYEGTPGQIGALAQKISGELGLKYEEIPCDAALPQKLQEANDNNVPTVLFGDPGCLAKDPYAGPMRQYDKQYLLNCASLIVWEPGAKDSIEADPRWLNLKANVFRQKVANPPPHHEWRSIFSREDLDQRTRTVIEQIRSRLMNQLISDPGAAVAPRRADDTAVAESAAARGIPTRSLSHLEGSTQ